ncbi:hypothetical protein [Adhaeribacter radiodurans]|uniref:DUF3108 domain-containing protein n=1 Tax=Adhaeribacter radiodurans TaxID=2745197 RepID=A0A7L7LCS5_9BACT|nr:hypothetical protein [Adhaeribacter radiodurans]QMU30621.1 hypothetical protein HUW48_22485 [Adhaeribacter radiodurans]
MKIYIFLLAFCVSLPTIAQSVDTIRVGDQLNIKQLRPGVKQYVRYVLQDGKRIKVDLWTRTTEFIAKTKTVRISQALESFDSSKRKTITSTFHLPSFSPIHHERATELLKEEFTFLDTTVLIKVNGEGKTPLRLYAPTYNFETDAELFQMLPWRENYIAVLNFYHPGSGVPDWYTFKVDGVEEVTTSNGQKFKCFKIITNYNKPEYGTTIFWFDTKSRHFVKQKSELPGGGVLIKALVSIPEF